MNIYHIDACFSTNSFLYFQDTYHNLTLKTIMGLKWMSIFCPQAQYVLKTDDDIYVNVDLLHRSLLEESKTLSQNIHGK